MAGITKRLRFEILRRDNYTCQYCGAKAPDVLLNVDAVVPEALGGSHKDPANLVTACENCNNGKTSTHPDAPFVAGVAEDALRWARAIQASRERLLGDLEARTENYEEFEQCWSAWTCPDGDGRHVLPKPAGWQRTIDQFMAAGLPMAILAECVDIAMGATGQPGRRGVAHDQVFRYMCGVAWRKVTELQETARAIITGGDVAPEDDADDDHYWSGVYDGHAEVAYRILRESLPPQDAEWYIGSVSSDRNATEDAASLAFSDLVARKCSLIRALEQLIMHVDANGEALNAARAQRGNEPDTPATETELLCLAVRIVTSNEPTRAGRRSYAA